MGDLGKYLRKKQKMIDKKNKTLRLEIDGEIFEFQKLSDDKFEDIQARMVEFNLDKSGAIMDGILRDIVYFSCAEIRNPELFAELGVVDPPDVVDALFTKAEISAAGTELIYFNGMHDGSDVVKKV